MLSFPSQQTFHYTSTLWSNKESLNLDGGRTGFDSQETKLPSYWNTSFSKTCLGMKIGQQIKFIVINRNASSLYSLIADGQYRNTSLGRDTWKSVVGPGSSLKLHCNKEGFNSQCKWDKKAKARIGIVQTMKESVAPVTLESDLVPQEILLTLSHVETIMLLTRRATVKYRSGRLGTSWCSEEKLGIMELLYL